MGADKAVHVNDDAIHGSDAVATAKVLAKAIGTVGDVDLVIAGNEATDGRSGAMAGMIGRASSGCPRSPTPQAHRRRRHVTVKRRDRRGLRCASTASLPAVVSVAEKINEPRYPSFKGIMAAKKKPVNTLRSPTSGIDASRGRAGQRRVVR